MTSATRTWTFLTGLMILIVILGHAVGGREGLLWAVGLALTLNSLVYLYPDLRLKLFFKGKVLEGKDPWGVMDKVKKLAQQARIPIPQVKLLPISAPQAMTLGRSPKNAQILITQGLIEALEPTELEAVLATQMALIHRQDIVALTVAAAFLDFIFSICRPLDSALRFFLGGQGTKKSGAPPLRIVSSFLSPIVFVILRIEIGKSDYLESDKLAAQWITDPNALAQALWKLHSLSQTTPLEVPMATSHLWVVSPLHRHDWTQKLQTQPNVESRIRNLVGYFPI